MAHEMADIFVCGWLGLSALDVVQNMDFVEASVPHRTAQ